MPAPRHDISEARKTTYYFGLTLTVLGALLFGSVFVSFAIHFGEFDPNPGFGQSFVARGFGGMVLMIVGGLVSSIGSRGAAGSGIVLDPRKAREDLEPWSRMAGGMVGDALSETGLGKSETAEQIKIRCLKCRALNDEPAKFCQQCGSPL